MANRKLTIMVLFCFVISPVTAMKRVAGDPVEEPAAKRHKITDEFSMDDLRISEHEKREFNDKICGDFESKLSYALSSGDFFKSTVYLRRMNARIDFDSNAIMADICMNEKWTEAEQIDLLRLLPGADFTEPVEHNNGSTPLHMAVIDNKPTMVSWLLHDKRIDPNIEDGNGCKPILFAHSAHVAKILCEKGADITVTDTFGATPLHLSGNAEQTHFLLSHGLNPNQADNKGRTPLFSSAGLARWDNAAELMAAGADHEQRDRKGKTPYEQREEKYGDANPVVMNTGARNKAMQKFVQGHSNPVSFLDHRSRTDNIEDRLKHLRITR